MGFYSDSVIDTPTRHSYFINTGKCPYKFELNIENKATTSFRYAGINFKHKRSIRKEFSLYEMVEDEILPLHRLMQHEYWDGERIVHKEFLVRIISPISILDMVGYILAHDLEHIQLLHSMWPFSELDRSDFCPEVYRHHCKSCNRFLGLAGYLLLSAKQRLEDIIPKLPFVGDIAPNDVGIYGDLYDYEHFDHDPSGELDMTLFNNLVMFCSETLLLGNISLVRPTVPAHKTRHLFDSYGDSRLMTYLDRLLRHEPFDAPQMTTEEHAAYMGWTHIDPTLQHLFRKGSYTTAELLPSIEDNGEIIVESTLFPPFVANPTLPPEASQLYVQTVEYAFSRTTTKIGTTGPAIAKLAHTNLPHTPTRAATLDPMFMASFEDFLRYHQKPGGLLLFEPKLPPPDAVVVKYGVPVSSGDDIMEAFNNAGCLPITPGANQLISFAAIQIIKDCCGGVDPVPTKPWNAAWVSGTSAGFPFNTIADNIRRETFDDFQHIYDTPDKIPLGVATAHEKASVNQKSKMRGILAPNTLSQMCQKALGFSVCKAMNINPDLAYKGGQSLYGLHYERLINKHVVSGRHTYSQDFPTFDSKASSLFQRNSLEAMAFISKLPNSAEWVKLSYHTSVCVVFIQDGMLCYKLFGVMSGSAYTAQLNFMVAMQHTLWNIIFYILTTDIDPDFRSRLFPIVFLDTPITTRDAQRLIDIVQIAGVGDDQILSLPFELDLDHYKCIARFLGGYDFTNKILPVEDGVVNGYCSHVAFTVTDFYGRRRVIATVPADRILGSAIWLPKPYNDHARYFAKYYGLMMSCWNNILRDLPAYERQLPLVLHSLTLQFDDESGVDKFDVGDNLAVLDYLQSLIRLHQHSASPLIPFPTAVVLDYLNFLRPYQPEQCALLREQVIRYQAETDAHFAAPEMFTLEGVELEGSDLLPCDHCGVICAFKCACGLNLCAATTGSCAVAHHRRTSCSLSLRARPIKCSHTHDLGELFFVKLASGLKLGCAQCLPAGAPLVDNFRIQIGQTSFRWLYEGSPSVAGNYSDMYQFNFDRFIHQRRQESLHVLSHIIITTGDKDPKQHKWTELMPRIGHYRYSIPTLVFKPTATYAYILHKTATPWPCTYSAGEFRSQLELPHGSVVVDSTNVDLIPFRKIVTEKFDPLYFQAMIDARPALNVESMPANTFNFITGPPGCGKTYTAVRLLRSLLERTRESILVLADSHASADVIAHAAFRAGLPVRRLDPQKENYTPNVPAEIITENSRCNDLHIMVRTTKSSHVWRYKTLLLEESGLNNLLIELAAIFFHKPENLIMIGDPKQRAPILNIDINPKQANVFNYLYELGRHFVLTTCYRCPQRVVRFFSNAFYSGQVKSANQLLGELSAHSVPPKLDQATYDLVRQLTADETGSSIAILAPTHSLVNLLRDFARTLPYATTVKTIDAAQGDEWDVVVLVLAGGTHRINMEPSRFNVGVSRTRKKLHILYSDRRVLDFLRAHTTLTPKHALAHDFWTAEGGDPIEDLRFTQEGDDFRERNIDEIPFELEASSGSRSYDTPIQPHLPSVEDEEPDLEIALTEFVTDESPDYDASFASLQTQAATINRVQPIEPLNIDDIPNTLAAHGKAWYRRYVGTSKTVPDCNVFAVDCEFVYSSYDRRNNQKPRQFVGQIALLAFNGAACDFHLQPYRPDYTPCPEELAIPFPIRYFDPPGFRYWRSTRRHYKSPWASVKRSILQFIQNSAACGRVAFLTKGGRLDWGILSLLSTHLGDARCAKGQCHEPPMFHTKGDSFCKTHTVIRPETLLIQPITLDLDIMYPFIDFETFEFFEKPLRQAVKLSEMHSTFCDESHGTAHDALCDARMTFCVYDNFPRSLVYRIAELPPRNAGLKRFLAQHILPRDAIYLGGGRALGDVPNNIDIAYGRDMQAWKPTGDELIIYFDSHYYATTLHPGALILGSDNMIRNAKKPYVFHIGENHFYTMEHDPILIAGLPLAKIPKVGPCSTGSRPARFLHFHPQPCDAFGNFCSAHSSNYCLLDSYLSESNLLLRQVPSAPEISKVELEARVAACVEHVEPIDTPPHSDFKGFNNTRKKLYAMFAEAAYRGCPINAPILCIGGHNVGQASCHFAKVLALDYVRVSCSETNNTFDCPDWIGPWPNKSRRPFIIVSDMYPVTLDDLEAAADSLEPGGSMALKITNTVINSFRDQTDRLSRIQARFERSAIAVAAQVTFSSEAFIIFNHKDASSEAPLPDLISTYNLMFRRYVASETLRVTDFYPIPSTFRLSPRP